MVRWALWLYLSFYLIDLFAFKVFPFNHIHMLLTIEKYLTAPQSVQGWIDPRDGQLISSLYQSSRLIDSICETDHRTQINPNGDEGNFLIITPHTYKLDTLPGNWWLCGTCQCNIVSSAIVARESHSGLIHFDILRLLTMTIENEPNDTETNTHTAWPVSPNETVPGSLVH